MRLALDTNCYCDAAAGDASAAQTIRSAEAVFVPFVVLAELRAGFAAGTRQAANEQVVNAFLSKPVVAPLFADERTVATYAGLFVQLRSRGRSIPHNDLWIAALCVQHSLTLFTRDAHFDAVPQLARC